MTAYSNDLRVRVLADCAGGSGTRAVAAKYRVSESWVRRLKQVRLTGRTGPAALAGGRVPGWVIHADAIRSTVAAAPDATLAEYRGWWRPSHTGTGSRPRSWRHCGRTVWSPRR